ncbi:pitrilysin family protein [Terasakiella sp. A23]|uniref:M16 family metallopeptidase n=1 Tax=Terasakiella sp. FCG-A23 TaxID=3080561 RepID=UPI002952BC70|nr:pitrilysin family protein [Terasakiella sp. A23]MDV7338135.1 pitrilysin family protein [Terasakiella sp. A23]
MKYIIILLVTLFSLPVHALAPVQEVTSDKGIKAWLIEDHTNPIVAMRFSFRGGSALDPDGKEGLARLASSTMDEGAGKWDSQGFQSRLEDLSITIRFEAGMDSYSGRLLTLSENLDASVDMLKTALTDPRFETEPVERIRSQILADLRQREEDPDSLAALSLYKQIFGDHPYARGSRGTLSGVANITPDDLKSFAKTRLGKDNLIVGVSGDITPDQLKVLLDKTFGDLPDKAASWHVPAAKIAFSNGLTVIDKPVPQSSIIFAQKGIERDHKDFYPAYVLNYILGGGGFSSRLYEEVREKRGLVYSVYSYLANYEEAELWMAGAGTQNARVKETLDVVRAEWEKAAREGVSEQEVMDAKTYLTGSFALRFKSSDAIASILVGMQKDHLPIDFLETRNQEVEAVTPEDVNRVAKSLLTPENLMAVVVGQPTGL